MKQYDTYIIVVLCLAVAVELYGCAPAQMNGGGTLPSTSGNAADKANFGFCGDSCSPGVIIGTFNYHDKNAAGWPNGGVKLNGRVFDVAKCSTGEVGLGKGIACGICNLQFCNCPGWPSSLQSCISGFFTDQTGFCQNIKTVPDNLYGVGFDFTSTNPHYPGRGFGVACITDNGQGKKAINKDYVVLIIGIGQYEGYINQGSVQGNIATGPCFFNSCLTENP